MYSWVSTEFRRHGIPSIRNSVDTEFRRHGIPSTRNSVDTEFRLNGISSTTKFRRQRNSVDTEFPRGHGIPPPTRNSPVDTEFPRGHGILSTRNSVDTKFVDTEFRQHGIPPTRNSAYYFYFRIFSMLCYAIYLHPIHGIPRNSAEFREFTEPVSTISMNLGI
jgi:hypothetical protein